MDETLNEEEYEKIQQMQREREQKLKEAIKDMPDEMKKIFNILKDKEQIDKELNEQIDLMQEYQTPKAKRKLMADTLEKSEANEKIKIALDILKEKEEVEKEIKRLEEELAQNKHNKANNQENEYENANNFTYDYMQYEEDLEAQWQDFAEQGIEREEFEIWKSQMHQQKMDEENIHINQQETQYQHQDYQEYRSEYETTQENTQNEKQENAQESKEELEKEKQENIYDKEEKQAQQEMYDQEVDDLEKKMEKQLQKLKDKKEELEDSFGQSIDNLMNAKDMGEILKALMEMDKAMALILKENKNIKELQKQREEKLLLAFKNPAMKEVVKDFLNELHENKSKIEQANEMANKEKLVFAELNMYVEMERKGNYSEKDIAKLEKIIKEIDAKTPNFKQTYPKMNKKANEILKKMQEKVKEREKNQKKGREL